MWRLSAVAFVFLVMTGGELAAQPRIYAQFVIDELTQPQRKGRGYVDSADYEAAQFLRHQLMQLGVKPLHNSYEQLFFIQVNTFPDTVSLVIGRRHLQPGVHFLIDPASPPLRGLFTLSPLGWHHSDTSLHALQHYLQSLPARHFHSTLVFFFKKELSKRQYEWLRQWLLGSNHGAAGILEITTEKLTWHVSRTWQSLPWFYVTDSVFDAQSSQAEVVVQSVLKRNYRTQNIAGIVPGRVVPDSFLVFTAHYDHIGIMGEGVVFPGANDNASGVSMVLNLAAHYVRDPHRYSVVFLFFSAEELGMLGSWHFVSQPVISLDRIRFLINLDIVGTGDEGLMVVNGKEFPEAFQLLVRLNEQHQLLPVVRARGPAANSDHYPFYTHGVPCFFLYTLGGIAAYHDVWDRAATLPLTEYDDLYALLLAFAEQLPGLPR